MAQVSLISRPRPRGSAIESGNPASPLPTDTVITFDMDDAQAFTDDASATKHAVEAGVDLVDHILLKPTKVTLSVTQYNAPLGLDPRTEPEEGRATSTWETLLALRDRRELVRLVTPVRVLDDMAILSVKVARSGDISADELRFSVEFEQARIATPSTLQVPPEALGAGADSAEEETDRGDQSGESDEDEEEPARSWAASAYDWVAGQF